MPTLETAVQWGQARLRDLLAWIAEAWAFVLHEAPGWWSALLTLTKTVIAALGAVLAWLWLTLQAVVAWAGTLVSAVREGAPVLLTKLDAQATAGVETLHLSAAWLAGQFDLGGALVLPLAVAQGALIGILLGAVGLTVAWTIRTRGVLLLLLLVTAGVVFASTQLAR